MAQRSITLFFSKASSKDKTESNDISKIVKNEEQNNPGNTKRKRDSIEDKETTSSSSIRNSSKKKSVSKSPSSLGKTNGTRKIKLSPIKTTEENEKRKAETPLSASKKKKKLDKTKNTPKKSNAKKELKDKLNNEEQKENELIVEKKTDSNFEASKFSPEVAKSKKDIKNNEKKVVKKRLRIIAPIDSSDEEETIPLTESPKKANVDERKESPVDEKEISDEDVSDDKKNNVEEKKKEDNIEKPVKKMHNFFAPKEKEDIKNIDKDKKKSSSHSYNPSVSKYNPINDAFWKQGERVPYIALTRTLELIEETSARLKIIEILSNYFRSVIVLSPDDLLPSIYLCLNQLAPAYEGIELGVAETNLMKAIAQCTGRTVAQIKADVQTVGDLGIVAEGSRSNQRTMFQPAPLTVSNVYTRLKEIAQMTGSAVRRPLI